MTGLGAWSYGEYYRDMPVPDARVAAGIFAFKQELIYCGYGSGIKLDLPIFGNMVEARLKEFQEYAGLEVDGKIWSNDARALFRKRSNDIQEQYRIPYSYLAKIKTLESNNDPVAQGYVDSNDEGIMQFHLPYYPDLSIEEAWNPAIAMPLAAVGLRDHKIYTTSWEGAVAAHNIGLTYAKRWVAEGYPEEGGPIMGVDSQGNPIYAFTRATNYLRLVKSVRL